MEICIYHKSNRCTQNKLQYSNIIMSGNIFGVNAKISQKSLINPKFLFLGLGVGNSRNDCLFKIKEEYFSI